MAFALLTVSFFIRNHSTHQNTAKKLPFSRFYRVDVSSTKNALFLSQNSA